MKVLPENQVRVFQADIGHYDIREMEGCCLSWLEAGEQERFHRSPSSRHRQQLLLSRVLLRSALTHLYGASPDFWRINYTSRGQPRLECMPEGRRPPRISLAHSGHLVACAVSPCAALGLDVESCKARDFAGLARAVFSPAELADFRRLRADLQGERFYRLWTLKEAYSKACGLGLQMPFRDIGFSLGEVITLVAPDADPAAHWQFAGFTPAPDVIGALALRRQAGGLPVVIEYHRMPGLHRFVRYVPGLLA